MLHQNAPKLHIFQRLRKKMANIFHITESVIKKIKTSFFSVIKKNVHPFLRNKFFSKPTRKEKKKYFLCGFWQKDSFPINFSLSL